MHRNPAIRIVHKQVRTEIVGKHNKATECDNGDAYFPFGMVHSDRVFSSVQVADATKCMRECAVSWEPGFILTLSSSRSVPLRSVTSLARDALDRLVFRTNAAKF